MVTTPDRSTVPDGNATTTQERGGDNLCSLCGRASELPFCEYDGTVIRVFTVGEHYRVERLESARRHAFVYLGSHVSGQPVRIALAREAGRSAGLRRAATFSAGSQVKQVYFGHEPALNRDVTVLNPPSVQSTADRLKRGPLEVPEVVEALISVAQTLQKASEAQTLHGGLEVDDVWMEPGSFVGARLMGFGFGPRDDAAYAPEYALGTPATNASDVYSFGQVAFALLTGRAYSRATREPASTYRTMPPALDKLLRACLNDAPNARPGWNAIANVLRGLAGQEATDVAVADPLIGQMIGSYRVVKLLGEGGMGAVYKGVHPRIGTHVAIKVLHAEIAKKATVIRRFEREAKASSTIGSNHIPKFFDFGTLEDGRPYAVMEYFEGESVAERVDRVGAMPYDQVRDALVAASEALAGAHEKSIIHRDVKPDNLFLARESSGKESIRLLDFGIAKVASPEGTQLTHAGSFLGTPVYCAPEQMYGLDPTPQMDVYALGATAYEMLTGEIPYGGDVQAVLKAKAARQDPDLSGLASFPKVVQRTLKKAMEYDPDRRYISMTAFADAIRTWPSELDESTLRLSPPASPSKSRVLALGAALTLALGAGVWFFMQPEDVAITPEPTAIEPGTRPNTSPAVEAESANTGTTSEPQPTTPSVEPGAGAERSVEPSTPPAPEAVMAPGETMQATPAMAERPRDQATMREGRLMTRMSPSMRRTTMARGSTMERSMRPSMVERGSMTRMGTSTLGEEVIIAPFPD
ncbi:MAG: protein kinase [Myxococcota bacterium]